MPSSSKPSAPPPASGTAACPASTPPTCRPTSCVRSPSAPASTPPSSTTSIWGCVMQIGEQTFDIARTAVLSAGWPESVPGTTVDRQCGSSQQAVHFAAAGVISGQYDIAVAGGVEVMSRTPMGSTFTASPLGADYSGPLRQRLPEPGRGRRGHRRHLGLQPHPARRVRAAQPRARPGRHRRAAPSRSRSRPVTNPEGTVISTTRASAPAARWRSWPPSSRPSAETARSPPRTPRRSPTARRRC